MTTNTNSKWYTNVVNEWLTEHGSFLSEPLDGVMTISSINDMYPNSQYNLVELSDKVVVIANHVFSFSAVIFIKDIATVDVETSYNTKRNKDNSFQMDEFRSLVIRINDEVKLNVPLHTIKISQQDEHWETELMNYVQNHIIISEPQITERMIEENISHQCFGLIDWRTLKHHSTLHKSKKKF